MPTQSPLRVPALVSGVDVRALPLGALEGFLLSRVDGLLTLAELGEMTGLGTAAVTDIVERLVSLGAARWMDSPPSSQRPSRAPAAERNPDRSKTPSHSTRPPTGRVSIRVNPAPPDAIRGLYDPIELEEDVELEIERRRQILDTFYQLEVTNYYQLLELPADADKKDIRSAYFALSKVFHPDTMFRRRLGTYKQKMEVIFRRLTEAYETLGNKKTREAYDDYLAISEATSGTRRELAEGEKIAVREAARVGATPVHGLSLPPNPSTVPPPPIPPKSELPPPPSQPAAAAAAAAAPAAAAAAPVGTPRVSPLPPGPPSDSQRRRMQELLAYRLQSVTRAHTPVPQTPPPRAADPAGASRDLVRALQQSASLTGGGDLASRHLADGLRAERDGKLVEAVNALRVARAVEGERGDIVVEHERLKKLLATELADTYLKQARYEEGLGKWGPAALSWSRVCEGRPDDLVAHRRTAEALLKSNGDLHQARAYAQRALDLAPDDPKGRTILAQVFIAAGLTLNAKRELEIAAKLDPRDDLVKNLLRELK